MRLFSSPVVSFVSFAAIALSACAGADDGVSTGGDTASAVGDAGSSLPAGSCQTGASEACTCLPTGSSAPIPGTRGCSQGVWLGCSCGQQVTTTATEECLAGRYEGDFSGLYASGFAGGIPIPVIALDLSGKPGLAFTLLRSDSGDQEFATYTVSNGYLEGEADGLFPIKGVITGTLDCKTKRFTGELAGGYSILLPLGLNEGTFKGPVTGEYDVATHSFKFGTWDVKESADVGIDLIGSAGGEGEWTAMHVGP